MEGFYLLADDHEWPAAEVTIKSLRLFHPQARLILIPRSAQVERVAGLAEQVFQSQDLRLCDQFGERLAGRSHSGYRKLLAWKGPLERFICLESPCLVTGSLEFLFQSLHSWGFVLGSSEEASFRKYVWKPSIYLRTPLTNEQLAFAAPTCLLASRRDSLSWDRFSDQLEEVRAWSRHLNLAQGETAFLNYLMVTARAPRTSLLEWIRQGKDRRCVLWAGQRGGHVQGGTVSFLDDREVVLVHWAGCWKSHWWRRRPYQKLWDYYQGLAPASRS